MGLSRADFDGLTLEEFEEAVRQFHKWEESDRIASWERSRMVAFCAVSPYSKKINKPRDLMTFPWEKITRTEVIDNKMSEDELKDKFKELEDRYG